MRSKWHTLAVAGSLGLFASCVTAVADDGSSGAWPSLSGGHSAFSNSATTHSASRSSEGSNVEAGRVAQELLRQAMVELDANRFETARRLTRRAAAIGVTAGFVGVHPEQVLAEIDRRERDAAGANRMVSADSGRSHKARAIELLDRGLLSLDEKHFDDAEQFARQAAQLHVNWDKYDYRPENLLEEIRRQRPSVASEGVVRPAADSTFDARPGTAADAHPPMEWGDRTSVPSSSLSIEARRATNPSPTDSYRSNEPLLQTIPQRPVPPLDARAARRPPAERLLQQAMDDLRAGRDELARHRIEQALGAIPGSPQSAAMASFGTAANSNRPIGLSPMGLAPSRPIYSPSTSSQVFFPIRRDQPNVVSASPAQADVALKPMHDPYLGDEPTTTDKSSPGAQTMRESVPLADPINPVYLARRSTPSMAETPVQRVGYESPATQATPSTALPPRVQTAPNAPAISPQIGWLEKMSVPIPAQGAPGGSPSYAPAAAPQRGFNPAPIAPAASMDSQWAPGRMPTPSGTDPAIDNSPEQPKPSLFHKIWDAMSGE